MTPTFRPQIKLTSPAFDHLTEIVNSMRAAGQTGSNKITVVSDLILAQRIPNYQHEKKLAVAVDYCPKCEQLQPYHNGHCRTCSTGLVHMTAVPTDELNRLMAMARQIVSISNRGE